jgi:hypothetical protein
MIYSHYKYYDKIKVTEILIPPNIKKIEYIDIIRGGKTGRARRNDPFGPPFRASWVEVFSPVF